MSHGGCEEPPQAPDLVPACAKHWEARGTRRGAGQAVSALQRKGCITHLGTRLLRAQVTPPPSHPHLPRADRTGARAAGSASSSGPSRWRRKRRPLCSHVCSRTGLDRREGGEMVWAGRRLRQPRRAARAWGASGLVHEQPAAPGQAGKRGKKGPTAWGGGGRNEGPLRSHPQLSGLPPLRTLGATGKPTSLLACLHSCCFCSKEGLLRLTAGPRHLLLSVSDTFFHANLAKAPAHHPAASALLRMILMMPTT